MMVKASETAMKAGVVVVGALTTEGAEEGSTERSVVNISKNVRDYQRLSVREQLTVVRRHSSWLAGDTAVIARPGTRAKSSKKHARAIDATVIGIRRVCERN